MYELIFDDQAIEFLEQIPFQRRKEIWELLQKTKSNPYKHYKSLRKRNDYSLTTKNVRIIADISDKKKRIEITLIAYRSNVYRKKK